MSKTIVLVGNTSWGMHQFRGDLIKSLIDLGHRIIVIAPEDESTADIKNLGCEFESITLDRKGINPFKDISYLYKLLGHLLHFKPDIVLSYTIKPILYGTLASWLVQTPTRIAITTGLGYTFSRDNWVSKVSKVLHKLCLHFSSEIWFLNNSDKDTFIDLKLISNKKAFVLPGEGVDTKTYFPYNKKQSKINFTLISRMLWDKGVSLFVQSAKEIKKTHPNINFIVAGPIDQGNPEAIPLSQLHEWHKQNIIQYIGNLKDVRELLSESSCLIHPTFYKEGLPRILMEANAMGVICITTDIPGCKDVIIEGVNGFLVQPNSTEDLVKKIHAYINMKEEKLKVMSENAVRIIHEKYSSEKIVNIYRSRLNL